MLSGLHAPNRALSPATYDVIKAGAFRAVKLLNIAGCQHSLAEARACLAAGASEIMLRLPDSRLPSGNYPSYTNYAQACITAINEWHGGIGCKLYQVDNEPNWTWTRKGFGPANYQWFMHHALPLIRHGVPGDVELVCPPLSFAPALWHHDPPGTPPEKRVNPTDFILDDWFDAYGYTDAEEPHSLMQLFDRIGSNCYFQSAHQMADPSFGANYQTMFIKSLGLQGVVGEWASSAHKLVDGEGKPLYTPAQINALRTEQYPRWVAQASQAECVDASFCWLGPSATAEWTPYELTTAVAGAMKQ